MIRLEQLHGDKGAQRRRKRIGRGESSGRGKTAGRGHKGAKARAGASRGGLFEGGQTPLARRIPKRGFSNRRRRARTRIVNVSALNRFDDGATVDFQAFVDAGLVGGKTPRVKILGDGALEKKLTVEASAFSALAKEKIEKAGGRCETVEIPRKASDQKGSD